MYTAMPGHRNWCQALLLVGFMYLMVATAASRRIKVSLDSNFNKTIDAQRIFWRCKCCSTNLLNRTNNYSTSLSPTPPETTKPKLTNFRIPTDLYPLHYELELFPNMTDPDPKNFTFKGYVKIWLTCKNATDKLTLHSKGLTIDPNSTIFSGGPRVISQKEDSDRQFLILQLDTNATRGQNYSIEMNFTASLKDDLLGFYLSQYTKNGTPVYLATTQFQPHYARRAFPCFDEPAIKATFDITLVRPANYSSISNMPIQASKEIQIDNKDYVKDMFMRTEKMSTYLLAFVVCDFEKIESTAENGVLFRVWARSEVINQTKYSFDVGLKVFPYFENLFKVRYPFPKLDMVAVPTFQSSGMENWGLMIIRESSMVTKENESLEVAMIVNHEIAHQWFGDLVSPSWWDALWLNEGFSSYLHSLGMEYYNPEWKTFDTFVIENHIKAFSGDSLVSSHPIYVTDVDPSEIEGIFDAMTYQKAAAIIRMMTHVLGFEMFTRGLSLYLARHQYGAATQDDLWSALTEQARLENKVIDVKELMDTWTLQMNYPLVTVTQDNSHDGVLKVQQQRYLENPNASEIGRYVSPFNYTWNIPLTFASNYTRNFNESNLPIYWLWRNETSKSIDVGELLPSRNTWFICNINMNGYYRVNYDISNWLALAKQLKEDHEAIPVINRVQIVTDAWTLAKRNILPYDTVFSIMDYLENEKHNLPWFQASTELHAIGAMLCESPIYGEYQKFMRKKYDGVYRYYEAKRISGQLLKSEKDIHHTMTQMACNYGIQDCIDNIVAQYKRWMGDPTNTTLEHADYVYCLAISEGDEKEWNFLLKMYEAKQAEEWDVIYGLSCGKEPWIINRYLQMSIEDVNSISTDAKGAIPLYTSSHIAGKRLTWDFFRANFDKISQIYKDTLYWNYLIDWITQSLNTELQLNELKTFKREQDGKFGSGEAAMLQAIQKVESNVQWMKAHYNTIATWLKANVN